jgi:hypothetical protein
VRHTFSQVEIVVHISKHTKTSCTSKDFKVQSISPEQIPQPWLLLAASSSSLHSSLPVQWTHSSQHLAGRDAARSLSGQRHDYCCSQRRGPFQPPECCGTPPPPPPPPPPRSCCYNNDPDFCCSINPRFECCYPGMPPNPPVDCGVPLTCNLGDRQVPLLVCAAAQRNCSAELSG